MNTSQPQPNNLSDSDLELLSAYLDNALNVAERINVERRLESDPLLRAELDDLRATVMSLRNLEPLRPPRSFTIDPATAPRRAFSFPLAWVMQLGSGLAGLVLVLVASVQIFIVQPQSGGNVSFEAYSQPAAEAPAQAPLPTSAAASAPQEPNVMAEDSAAGAEMAPQAATELQRQGPEATAAVEDTAMAQSAPAPAAPNANIELVPTDAPLSSADSVPPGAGGGAPAIDVPESGISSSESSSPDTIDPQVNADPNQPVAGGIPPGLLLVIGLVLIGAAGASYLYRRQRR
ncbi:MAG: hypothetical protein HC822_20455 [Oscillochloris sp.]|nr:hypothetical protein [Oscillochloris sp.]